MQIGLQSNTNQNSTIKTQDAPPLDLLVIRDLEKVLIFHGERPEDIVYQWHFKDATFPTTAENPEHYCPVLFSCAYFDQTQVDPAPPTCVGIDGWQQFIRRMIDARGEYREVVE